MRMYTNKLSWTHEIVIVKHLLQGILSQQFIIVLSWIQTVVYLKTNICKGKIGKLFWVKQPSFRPVGKTTGPSHLAWWSFSDWWWCRGRDPSHSTRNPPAVPAGWKQWSNSQSLTGGYCRLWLRIVAPTRQLMQSGGLVQQPFAKVDFIPKSGTKNLASGIGQAH